MKNTLQQVLEAMMTISVRGNDVITMSNCLQALSSTIQSMPDDKQPEAAKETVEPEIVG
jgi:hypothetical protein